MDGRKDASRCAYRYVRASQAMALRFDEAKATEAAAFLVSKRGGRMHYWKLSQFLYLADREALIRWGIPILTERYIAMDHGPVPSGVYSLIADDKPKPVWAQFISAPLGDYEVELIREAPKDKLSRAEESLLAEIFSQYGHRNRWDIGDNVMHNSPEGSNPHGSSRLITVRNILEAAGEDKQEITAIVRELHSMSRA